MVECDPKIGDFVAFCVTGDTAQHWQSLVDAFEARVKAQVLAVVEGDNL